MITNITGTHSQRDNNGKGALTVCEGYATYCKWISYTVIAIMAAWIAWKAYLLFIFPSIEPRELANVTPIQQFRDHVFDTVAEYPRNIYLYGSLQARILSLLPAWNDLMLNRLFSLLCLLVSVIPLEVTLRRYESIVSKKHSAPMHILFCACYLLQYLVDLPFTVGAPNYLGLLLSNSVMLVCTYEFRGKSVLLGVLLVGCFLTKQYYLISAIYVVTANFLLYPWKRGIRTIIAAGIIAFLGIMICFSSDQVLYSFNHHMTMASNSFLLCIKRFALFALYILPLLLPCAYLVVLYTRCLLKDKVSLKGFKAYYSRIENRAYICSILNLVIMALVLLQLAGHTGALRQTYISCLMTPSLILFCSLLFFHGNRAKICMVASCLLVTTSVYIFAKTSRQEIHSLEAQLDALAQYESDLFDNASVRGSTFTSFSDLAHGRCILENGQQQYIETIWNDEINFAWTHSRVLPYLNRNTCIENQLLSNIRNKKWDVIYMDACTYLTKAAESELMLYYKHSKVLDFSFPGYTTLQLVRWVKKE